MSAPPDIRRLMPDDRDQYFALRLAALEEHPEAYATDAESWRNAPSEIIERHLSNSRDDPSSPILGAFLEDRLIGIVGLSRDSRPSVSHKAGVWGFYVSPRYRRRGIGRALLMAAVSTAGGIGVQMVRAGVPSTGVEVISLMEDLGFIRYGVEPQAKVIDGVSYDQVYLWFPIRVTTEPS